MTLEEENALLRAESATLRKQGCSVFDALEIAFAGRSLSLRVPPGREAGEGLHEHT
jgi:hypothetical protein